MPARLKSKKKTERTSALPYTVHKRWGTAYTYIKDDDGRRRQIYLGKDGPEAEKRLLEIRLAILNGESIPVRSGAPVAPREPAPTIEHLVTALLKQPRRRYRGPDGEDTGSE